MPATSLASREHTKSYLEISGRLHLKVFLLLQIATQVAVSRTDIAQLSHKISYKVAIVTRNLSAKSMSLTRWMIDKLSVILCHDCILSVHYHGSLPPLPRPFDLYPYPIELMNILIKCLLLIPVRIYDHAAHYASGTFGISSKG